MTTQSIEISKLVKSPSNARRTIGKKACEELKASILAHGLLQNLTVSDAGDGTYHVVAGARRLAALHALQKAKKLPKDHAVPCQIVSDEKAAELSLAENTVRAAMHPADEFEAFTGLVDKGQTPEEIATSFGTSAKHVSQRLKLGRVDPELLAEYRAEKIDLECLMAFTLTDDRTRQMSVYKSLQGWQKGNARHIRSCLTDAMSKADSKLAELVGLDAYHAAGGRVKADLFGDDVYLEDTALLQRLAGERLEAEAENLRQDGWGWVEVDFEVSNGTLSKYGRIQPVPLDAPAELVSELEAAEAEQTRIAELIDKAHDDEDLDESVLEKLEAQDTASSERIQEIEERLESFIDFDPEQKKLAGCFVSVGWGGKIEIEKGLVRKEGQRQMAKVQGDDSGDDMEPEKPKGMPDSLRRDLEAYRLQVTQVEMAQHPEIAFDLLVFKAAYGVFDHVSPRDGADVHFRHVHHKPSIGDDGGEAMEAIKAKLPLGWLEQEGEAARFEAFAILTTPEKHALLAYCVASTLQPKLANDAEPSAYETALGLTGASVADYWRPTAANYLSRITRDQLLAIGQEVFGGNFIAQYGKSKKGELVTLLDTAFANPEKALDPEKVRRLAAWLPKGMAFRESSGVGEKRAA